MAFIFENLEVYQKAIAFADEISDLTDLMSGGETNYNTYKDIKFDDVIQNHNMAQGKVCDFLKGKLELQSLAGNFTKHQPNYFSVWEFKPKQA